MPYNSNFSHQPPVLFGIQCMKHSHHGIINGRFHLIFTQLQLLVDGPTFCMYLLARIVAPGGTEFQAEFIIIQCFSLPVR